MTEFTITVQCEFDGEILQEVQKFPSIECPNMRQYASEETKDLANDMASAKDACADWAPPVWLREKTALHKLVIFKVLPFLHNASTPKTYKTASVDVYTPGFLDLYSELDDILRGLSYREGSLTDRASGLMRCGAGVN